MKSRTLMLVSVTAVSSVFFLTGATSAAIATSWQDFQHTLSEPDKSELGKSAKVLCAGYRDAFVIQSAAHDVGIVAIGDTDPNSPEHLAPGQFVDIKIFVDKSAVGAPQKNGHLGDRTDPKGQLLTVPYSESGSVFSRKNWVQANVWDNDVPKADLGWSGVACVTPSADH
jgi:hypothetical protein